MRISSKLLFSILLVSIVNLACSGGNNPDRQAPPLDSEKITRLSGIEFETLPTSTGPATLQTINGAGGPEISGTGLLLAREALSEVKIGRHFSFQTKLSESGSIKLITFASRENNELKNGVEFEITWPLGSSSLKAVAKAGETSDDWSQFFANLNPTEEIALGFDVHNDENGEAHVVIWNLNGNAQQTPFFDSAVDVNGSPGKGFGRYWAIQIDNAVIRSASVSEPRNEH